LVPVRGRVKDAVARPFFSLTEKAGWPSFIFRRTGLMRHPCQPIIHRKMAMIQRRCCVDVPSPLTRLK
jgi:hypothetical protein